MLFWTVTRKDLKIIFRDRSALIFIFALPLVFVLMFGAMFGGRNNNDAQANVLKVLVSNQDTGKHGAELLAEMKSVGMTPDLRANADEVKKAVKRGDQAMGIVLPADFSATLEAAIRKPDAPQSRVQIITDPAQMQTAQMAKGALLAAMQRITGPLMRTAAQERIPPEFRELAAQNMRDMGSRAPVTLDVSTLSPERKAQPSAGDLFIPGFMVYFVFFMANSVAITLINERQEGTLRRMLSAPVGKGQILFGKLLARGLLGLLQTLILLVTGKLILHLSTGSSPFGLALAVLATIFAATGLGLLIASVGKTVEQIQGMTTFALVLMGLLSGCFWPRDFMPKAMQTLSKITPHAWALQAYQDLLIRSTTLAATFINIVVVFLFGVAFYSLALTRFRYE